MNFNIDKDLLRKYLGLEGEQNQIICLLGEMSELTKELTKKLRKSQKYNKDNVIEETADVLMMIEQMKYCLDITDEDIQLAQTNKEIKLREFLETI